MQIYNLFPSQDARNYYKVYLFIYIGKNIPKNLTISWLIYSIHGEDYTWE